MKVFKNATVYDAYDKVNVPVNGNGVELALTKFDCKFLIVK